MSPDSTSILRRAPEVAPAFFCPNSFGKSSQALASDGNQMSLGLAFGVHHAPKDAPAKLVRQIDSPAQALAVSIAAGGHKLAYVAAYIGKSIAYVSRMKSGERPIPEKLVRPLCAATGSNLLAQVIALNAALEEASAVERLAALLRSAA